MPETKSGAALASRWQKIDEIPFDFKHTRMSVVVAENTEHHQLVCKGALQEILECVLAGALRDGDCALR